MEAVQSALGCSSTTSAMRLTSPLVLAIVLAGPASAAPATLIWAEPLAPIYALAGSAFLALALAGASFVGHRADLDPGAARWGWLVAGLLGSIGSLFLIRALSTADAPAWVTSLEIALSLITTLLAVAASVLAWLMLPRMRQLPSRRELTQRIDADRRVLEELRGTRAELERLVEERTREVKAINKRFELALRDYAITVFVQDRDFRCVWMHNPPQGTDIGKFLGKTDQETLPPHIAVLTTEMKRRALAEGKEQRGEIALSEGDDQRWFELIFTPYAEADDTLTGLLCVAVEITQSKERERQLERTLRELTHRSKNMLAVLLGVARQTAARTTDVETFMSAFQARLHSLAATQDLLVEGGWRSVPLQSLIDVQVAPYLPDGNNRTVLDGPRVRIKPESAHNLGLAFNELAHNAATHGALSAAEGKVSVSWMTEPGRLRIVWQERGGPPVRAPSGSGFGRMVLERIIARALDGEARLAFEPAGVSYELSVDASHIRVESTAASHTPAHASEPRELSAASRG